jgi:hypothetical protein
MTSIASPAAAPSWLVFLRWFGAAWICTLVALFGFVVALDPYGIFASPRRAPAPIMDLNQRFMYPQIVRSERYDAAIFGTSSMRLVDPAALGSLLGARFANLGMNAATPWEQMQLASLFVRTVRQPKILIFGLDPSWCAADAATNRLTFRSFPPWLYDEVGIADLGHEFDLKSLEIATRVAAQRLGLARDRIRADGYEVFTPPEASYDLARARAHIWAGAPEVTPVVPAVAPSADERAAWRFPALAWLDALLAQLPPTTRVVLAFPPAHIAVQPRPGSGAEAHEQACKAVVAELAAKHGAAAADFRLRSPVTMDDANFWDPLHYRLPLANRLTHDLSAIASGTSGEVDNFFHMLTNMSQRER